MPWHREERYRRGKKVHHTTDPGRYRVHFTHAALHYESQMGSGSFDTEVNMTPQAVETGRLGGITTRMGYDFGYQNRAAINAQQPIGSLGFGGRRGESFFNLMPFALGYLNSTDRSFQSISPASVFDPPLVTVDTKVVGIRDEDPSLFSINAGATIDVGNIWQDGNNGVNYSVRLSGGRLEPVFTVANWKQWIARNPARDRAAEVSFGVLLRANLNDIARIMIGQTNRNRQGDDFSWAADLVFLNSARQPLAHLGGGQVFVPNRGGRANIVKRMWSDNSGQWWLFMGANLAEITANSGLIEGDLVIDPPISEESIAANADDASQNGNAMALSGIGNRIYLGAPANGYNPGGIFQSVPIGNGDTITTATYEPRQVADSGTGVTATLYGIDEDDAAAFTTTANDLRGRDRTASSINLTDADWPGNNQRAQWDVSGPVADITTRGGWPAGGLNRLGFVVINTSGGAEYDYVGFNDYSGGAANAADFNADVIAAGGGGFIRLLGKRENTLLRM